MRKLAAVFFHAAEREGRFIRSSRWEVSLLLWIPLLMVLLIWWIFSHGQINNLPVGVLNQDGSPQSQQLVRFMNSAPAIRVAAQYTDAAQAQQAMDALDVYGVVVIPRHFAADLKQGRAAPVVLQYNAQYGAFSGLVQRDVRAAVATFSAGVEIKSLNKRGMSLRVAEYAFSPIRTNTTSLFNISTDYQQFLASTVIPALMFIMAMTAGTSAVGRELRDHSLGRWLADVCALPSGQVPGFAAIVMALNGKLLWPMLAFTTWGGLALWLATHLHSIGMIEWLVTYFGLWLMLLVSLWLGVIVTTLFMSLRMGLSATGFLSAPSFAFAGVTFPVLAMPTGAQIWAHCLPLTHYIHMQIALLQMGAPASFALPTLWGFIVAVLVLLFVSAVLTRRAFKQPHRWGAR